MKLAVVHKGQVFEIDDENDLTEYDLSHPVAQAELARLIRDAMDHAIREVGR